MNKTFIRKNVVKLIFLALFVLILVSSLAFAVLDSDGDGVPDEFDRCPNTGSEVLPSPKNNPEYLGCSCTQIFELIDDPCKEVYCVPGRPLQVREAVYSVESIVCPKSYCMGTTLYLYPGSIRPLCVGGKPRETECSYQVIERAEECINNSVPQYDALQALALEVEESIVFFQPETTFQDKVYSLLRNEHRLRYGLMISKDAFEQIKLDVQKNSDTKKIVEKKSRVISGSDAVITLHSISIVPNKYISLKDVYVFEEVYDKMVLDKQIIHLGEQPIVFREQGIMVWKLDDISKPLDISYQFNDDTYFGSNIIVIAKVKNHFFTNIILPFALIIIMALILLNIFTKSLKKERIFK